MHKVCVTNLFIPAAVFTNIISNLLRQSLIILAKVISHDDVQNKNDTLGHNELHIPPTVIVETSVDQDQCNMRQNLVSSSVLITGQF